MVEISFENEQTDEFIDISLEKIAEKYIKYYWNQTIFFDLIQGSNLSTQSTILQKVKELIGNYFEAIDDKKIDRFEKTEIKIKYYIL